MVQWFALNTILAAMKQLKSQSYMHDCWLCCIGAWYEWELHEIDMAVPLSPNEVPEKKRYFFTISLKRTE
jgi:glucosamine-6-phosphate deaminase